MIVQHQKNHHPHDLGKHHIHDRCHSCHNGQSSPSNQKTYDDYLGTMIHTVHNDNKNGRLFDIWRI